jgi:hypothetical protein
MFYVCVYIYIYIFGEGFFYGNVQLEVDNILNYHFVVINAHMNNSIINWSTFLICNNVSQTLQRKKRTKNNSFNGNF